MRRITVLVSFAVSSVAFAQVGAPIMGLVSDHGAIRAMRGIPAAGNVDLPFASDSLLSAVEPAPSQNFVLATSAETGQVMLVSLSADASSVQSSPVNGASANPDRIVFSPNGTAAALWFSNDQHVEVLMGLTQTPTVRRVDVSPLLGGPLTAIAVNDDGQELAVAGSSSVFVLGGSTVTLPTAGTPQAIAFSQGAASSSMAVITDLEVVSIADPLGSATRTLVWSKPPGSPPNVQVAVGFAFSPDNRHLTVTGSLGGVETFDLSDNNGTYTDCGCTPTALVNLGGSVFRLTGIESGPVKLYDASTGQILLVPAAIARVPRPIKRPVELPIKRGPATGERAPK